MSIINDDLKFIEIRFNKLFLKFKMLSYLKITKSLNVNFQ